LPVPTGRASPLLRASYWLALLKVSQFVNADTIALGLSAFAPERVAFEAGRVMLARLGELAGQRADFAFETTLATRSYAPWLRKLKAGGYHVHLLFLWLPSADMAVARVAERVRGGGHHVPEATIRRRYAAGLANLRTLYLPLANSWQLLDNTQFESRRLIAAGQAGGATEVYLEATWRAIIGKDNQA
jgi:predicted ABC-type ATPase